MMRLYTVIFIVIIIVTIRVYVILHLVEQHGWSFSRFCLNPIEDEVVSLVGLKLVHLLVDVVHPLHYLLDLLLSSGVDAGLGDQVLIYSADFQLFN